MKQLFQVVSPNRDIKIVGAFFESKEAAKAYRDNIQNDHPGAMIVVRLGPDHWRYGLKGNPRTHSHNNRAGGSGAGFRKRPLK